MLGHFHGRALRASGKHMKTQDGNFEHHGHNKLLSSVIIAGVIMIITGLLFLLSYMLLLSSLLFYITYA